jgi:predicted enzyme related to lactoylglutathione lyase
MVNDQEKALKFYTETLGFVKKRDIPIEDHRWLTVVPKGDQNGPELLLEPIGFEPAKRYQKALYAAGIPLTAFHVEDIDITYKELKNNGVKFSMEPEQFGPSKLAVFDDTCGNLIQLIEVL